MTPTEMELRDQLEDLENQLADQDVMLRERDAALREVSEERDMLAARVKELEQVDHLCRFRVVGDSVRGIYDPPPAPPTAGEVELVSSGNSLCAYCGQGVPAGTVHICPFPKPKKP